MSTERVFICNSYEVKYFVLLFFLFILVDIRLLINVNLRRLKTNWVKEINLKSIEMLFEDDVLFSLTNFTLLGQITDFDVVHNVLSKVSSQCSYRFDVTWDVMDDEVSLPDTSNILLKTFEQLKGPIPIELEFSSKRDYYSIRAMTLPRMDSFFSIFSFQNAYCIGRSS